MENDIEKELDSNNIKSKLLQHAKDKLIKQYHSTDKFSYSPSLDELAHDFALLEYIEKNTVKKHGISLDEILMRIENHYAQGQISQYESAVSEFSKVIIDDILPKILLTRNAIENSSRNFEKISDLITKEKRKSSSEETNKWV